MQLQHWSHLAKLAETSVTT